MMPSKRSHYYSEKTWNCVGSTVRTPTEAKHNGYQIIIIKTGRKGTGNGK